MQQSFSTLAEQLLHVSKQLAVTGLNKGTSGNVSVRHADGFLVTPSGVHVEALSVEGMVRMQWNGSAEANKKPSSEWRFHRDILQAREDIHAVVHTHSMFATSGNNIRCAPYALFGSQALSDVAVEALEGRKACLLANHGMIAVGRDLNEALSIAIEVENLAEQYWRALQLGEPYILSEAEMREVFQQFKGYGTWADQQ
jgi:L-fuculose-phosphate aldolase